MTRDLSDMIHENNEPKIHDRFHSWRQTDDIGYVYLAFAVLVEAVKDLFWGTEELYEDTCFFWSCGEKLHEETLISQYSSCRLWLDVLGMDDIPGIVSDEIHGRKNYDTDLQFQKEVEEYLGRLERLFGYMKVDYYGILANDTD